MYQTEILLAITVIAIIGLAIAVYSHEQKINALMGGKRNVQKGSADKYYNILMHYYPQADALYEDTIINLVGREGLRVLRESNKIEACANFNERKIYAL